MIDFTTDPKMRDYKMALGDNFPLFRMFLADDVDAIIVHFLSEGKISLRDLKKLQNGLHYAIDKIARKYPNKMPKSDTDKLKVPKNLKYDQEDLNYAVVFKLTQFLVHLQASTAAFVAVLEPPTT